MIINQKRTKIIIILVLSINSLRPVLAITVDAEDGVLVAELIVVDTSEMVEGPFQVTILQISQAAAKVEVSGMDAASRLNADDIPGSHVLGNSRQSIPTFNLPVKKIVKDGEIVYVYLDIMPVADLLIPVVICHFNRKESLRRVCTEAIICH